MCGWLCPGGCRTHVVMRAPVVAAHGRLSARWRTRTPLARAHSDRRPPTLDSRLMYHPSWTLTRLSETMCGCWESCWARRCGCGRDRRCSTPSSGSGRSQACARRIRRATSRRWPACCAICRSMPALPVARAFSHFLTLANIAEQHHRVRRRRDYQRNPERRPAAGLLRGDVPSPARRRGHAGCAVRRRVRAANRARAHRASHRDHPAHADPQAPRRSPTR